MQHDQRVTSTGFCYMDGLLADLNTVNGGWVLIVILHLRILVTLTTDTEHLILDVTISSI